MNSGIGARRRERNNNAETIKTQRFERFEFPCYLSGVLGEGRRGLEQDQ